MMCFRRSKTRFGVFSKNIVDKNICNPKTYEISRCINYKCYYSTASILWFPLYQYMCHLKRAYPTGLLAHVKLLVTASSLKHFLICFIGQLPWLSFYIIGCFCFLCLFSFYLWPLNVGWSMGYFLIYCWSLNTLPLLVI